MYIELSAFLALCLVVVMCSELPDISNGTVTWAGLNPEDTATYTCDAGFVLDGLATRQCGIDGTWSGEETLCTRML